MPKFTQGKWEISDDGCIEIYDKKGLLVTGIAEVADFYTCDGQANARLIAAAPEMYEELCEALEFFKKEEFYTDEAKTYIKSIAELIARIDGEEENAKS